MFKGIFNKKEAKTSVELTNASLAEPKPTIQVEAQKADDPNIEQAQAPADVPKVEPVEAPADVTNVESIQAAPAQVTNIELEPETANSQTFNVQELSPIDNDSEKQKTSKNKIIALVVLTLVIFCAAFGISYLIFGTLFV